MILGFFVLSISLFIFEQLYAVTVIMVPYPRLEVETEKAQIRLNSDKAEGYRPIYSPVTTSIDPLAF